jgi:predicted membrane protein
MEANSMTLLFILLTIVILLAILLFTVRSRVNLIFDSTHSDMHLTLFWLYPLLKSVVIRENNGFIMTIYLLNKRVLTKQIKRKQYAKGNKNIIRSLNPTDIHVNTQYGFRDPFVTGLACSAITMASEFFNVESLHQKPDFLAINDYINLDATAKLNLGNSLMKLVQ